MAYRKARRCTISMISIAVRCGFGIVRLRAQQSSEVSLHSVFEVGI